MKKNIPYLSLDANHRVIRHCNGIDSLYPFLLEDGFFTELFRHSNLSDFSQPVYINTGAINPCNIKLLIIPDGEQLNCYVSENIDRRKRHNIANYQLRDPISSIFALLPVIVDNVNDGTNPKRAVAHVEGIFYSAYKLMRNISNLSLVDKIETGEADITEKINLSSLLESLCDSVKTIVKDVSISRDIDSDVVVTANRKLLTTGILNLISNSINYKQDGAAEISISLKSGEENAVFTYADNSKGIKDEYLSQVFTPFFADDPYADGGMTAELGLGLYIAQAAFTQAGGKLLMTSEFGKGVKYTAALTVADNNNMVLESSTADFLLNKYSDIFIQLCDVCTLPDII